MGRPSKYSPERAEQLLQAVRVGATLRLACQYAGISEDTLSRWRKSNADFADAIKQAEAAGAVGWLAVIEQASKQHWQAAAWKLERRFPQEYSLSSHVHLAHSGEVELTDGSARERISGRIDELSARRAEKAAAEGDDGLPGQATGV